MWELANALVKDCCTTYVTTYVLGLRMTKQTYQVTRASKHGILDTSRLIVLALRADSMDLSGLLGSSARHQMMQRMLQWRRSLTGLFRIVDFATFGS